MPFIPISPHVEYHKCADLKPEDVEIIVKWMDKQPHLPKITELQIILFLQSCHYRIEAAKCAIDKFFTLHTLCPEMFDPLDNRTLEETLSVNFIVDLPGLTPKNGDIVILAKLLDFNPSNYVQLSAIRLYEQVMMKRLYHRGTAEGLRVIIDMEGSVLGHVARINLAVAKKYIYYVQEALPVRLKGVHVVNVMPFAHTMLQMMRPFMKKELLDVISFHSKSMEELYEVVPQEMLPKEYGGEAPPVSVLQDELRRELLDNYDLFLWQQKQRVDEGKRVGPSNVDEIFGAEGTFKKLEFD